MIIHWDSKTVSKLNSRWINMGTPPEKIVEHCSPLKVEKSAKASKAGMAKEIGHVFAKLSPDSPGQIWDDDLSQASLYQNRNMEWSLGWGNGIEWCVLAWLLFHSCWLLSSAVTLCFQLLLTGWSRNSVEGRDVHQGSQIPLWVWRTQKGLLD